MTDRSEALKRAGLREALVTQRIEQMLQTLDELLLVPDVGDLANAEASDRISRHVARLVAQAIESFPESERALEAIRIARELLLRLEELAHLGLLADIPNDPGRVLQALLSRRPDGTPEPIDRPLTPLLDTTILTNAPGEPGVGHELRAEVHSAEAIDVVMAFIRWSGIQPLVDHLRRHCRDGKSLRILTTTYTNSTEQRALDELVSLGADVRVSYDTTMTRLHAKAWIFHRLEGYSTSYVGSSNLTYSAQVTGLEWNVRLSAVRNPDALAKMVAVFDSYFENPEFVSYDADEFARLTQVDPPTNLVRLPEFELEPRPFQERLLELIAVSRDHGHTRNLLVAATGTGKTVMAAIDYARLRPTLGRDRLLFIAHRAEILEQSRAIFRLALRDPTFGELWVGGTRPSRFEHVFASIQSLTATGVSHLDRSHFDVVIVDEFHHAAAPTYAALLAHVSPEQLLGLTATPERADGLDVLRYFDGRIAAELRVWDAIDQQYLAPFAYYGVHDGLDLRSVGWRRGVGYDPTELTNVLTASDIWARRVVDQVVAKVADPGRMRALGFCVSVEHARFMARVFNDAGLTAVAVWGDSPREERTQALRRLAGGSVRVVFTVDLFNEGVDVPTVDTLLLLRPTDSPTLFLQQLGRGLRRAHGKTICTVLDFVGLHRKEFRFDRRLRALLGGTRKDIERQVNQGFPFLPAGCHFELDPIAKDVVLRSIREAIPSRWADRLEELRALGDVSLGQYLEETGLELEDLYANNRSWSELRRATGLPSAQPGPDEDAVLRGVSRLLHVDDEERIDAYARLVACPAPPDHSVLPPRIGRFLRMLVSVVTNQRPSVPLQDAIDHLWEHPQALAELREVLEYLRGSAQHLHVALGLDAEIPLRVHARYTRNEILSAFGTGTGARPNTWQTGVWWDEVSRSDLFAFTLDKSVGAFSPTTRYRDYAQSPDLIHWESQGATAVESAVGQRYIHHQERETNVVLFARLRSDDRAFWCLGHATYLRHEGDRPIAFVWKLANRLPGDLYAEFAAAVA